MGKIIFIGILSFFVACKSPFVQLKDEHPNSWSRYMRPINVLSDVEMGKIIYKFKLEEDGNVSGGFLNMKKPRWDLFKNDWDYPLAPDFKYYNEYLPVYIYDANEPEKDNNCYAVGITNNNEVIESMSARRVGEKIINNNTDIYKAIADRFNKVIIVKIKLAQLVEGIGKLYYVPAGGYIYLMAENESDLSLINTEQGRVKKVSAQWKKETHKTVKKYLSYIKQTEGLPLQKEIQEELNTVLDVKVKKYFKKHHPAYYSYCDYGIYLADGSSSGRKFYELFRVPILAKNPETDMKMEYELSPAEDNQGIVVKYTQVNISLIFKPNNKRQRLIFTRMDDLNKYTSYDGFQLSVASGMIFSQMGGFPVNENIDVDLLDSL